MGRKRKTVADWTGHKFGRLTVISTTFRSAGVSFVSCRCDCGVEKKVRLGALGKSSKSCGCLHREALSLRRKTHGATSGGKRTPIYRIWSGIKERCESPTCKGFQAYGGRGIKLCERWDKFENFLADMGPRPSHNHSIDRKDNDGNYEPGNCRWATDTEQSRNRSCTVNLSISGRVQCVSAWATELNMSRATLDWRLKHGFPIEKILTNQKFRRQALPK